jgi:hypothetical protein
MSDTEVRMPSKSFRVPSELWTATLERANDTDERPSDVVRAALSAYLDSPPCDSCGNCDICGGEILTLAEYAEPDTATIMAFGSFDETTNPEVLALIDRAKELMAVGAVGVSVALDADPADMPDPNADRESIEDSLDAMMEAHTRVRHVAIVDTPAFSGAYLDIAQDGTLTGPVVFEGLPTGDGRGIPFENITLDESILPIPIIFDLQDGDHTGVVVGHIDRLERVSGIVGAEAAPLAASLNVDGYPSYLFAEPEPTAMTVHAPDAKGYRRYTGIIAPTGVCHKGRQGCYTYKGASLDYFHSGARIPLDDGTYTRVGPLMFGDLHADGSVMDYRTALERTNEDARTVFAMGRTFHHPKGLLFSGVLMEDADIMRVQATAPSVELWPDHRGKLELKTALQVPRPALPVAASLGNGGVQLVDAEPVIVEEPHGDHHTRLDELATRMDELERVTGELYAAHLTATL